MIGEEKLVLADFIEGDRFELNTYLTYLFNQLYESSIQTDDEN
jgi:hypothetical protein